MLKPDTFALTVVLAALTALGPLSTDLYVPTLPDIGRAFDVPPRLVQMTMYGYLIGFALGQVGYGPISDWYGRRSGLLVGLVCYCAGSLLCLFAPSIEILIGARVLQAFGASGAVVLARAVVRDFYSGARAGRELSMMGFVMAFVPFSAPLIGGSLHSLFGWRSAFAFLVGFGLLLIAIIARRMPETLSEKPEARLSLGAMLDGYRTLFRIRDFNLYLVLCLATYVGLVFWFTVVPYIYQNQYGLTPMSTAVAIAASSFGFLIGTSIATRIVVRAGLIKTIGIGVVCMTTGSAMLFLILTTGVHSLIGIVFAVGLNLAGLGLVYPQSLAGGLSCAVERAGAASSLLGGIPPIGAAIVGVIAAEAAAQKGWPAGVVLLAMALIIVAAWLPLHFASRRKA
jgi:DHA1 family bicyclomycin/chloramphenicol resistance-like MFS transporter